MADDAVLLVCLPAAESYFADDILAVCAACGIAVAHRPHAPAGAVPICLACYTARATPGDLIEVTELSVRELELYLAATHGIQ